MDAGVWFLIIMGSFICVMFGYVAYEGVQVDKTIARSRVRVNIYSEIMRILDQAHISILKNEIKNLKEKLSTRASMTTDEMVKRWPNIPPFEAISIDIWNVDSTKLLDFEITQDSIDEIIEYFKAAKESMNK